MDRENLSTRRRSESVKYTTVQYSVAHACSFACDHMTGQPGLALYLASMFTPPSQRPSSRGSHGDQASAIRQSRAVCPLSPDTYSPRGRGSYSNEARIIVCTNLQWSRDCFQKSSSPRSMQFVAYLPKRGGTKLRASLVAS